MGFKWPHVVLPECIKKKTVTALVFHEYHLLFQNPPHAPQFQNCRSLNHDGVDDVKIHICI